MGVVNGLFGGDLAAFQQIVHQGMVARKLGHFTVAHVVKAAVADP